MEKIDKRIYIGIAICIALIIIGTSIVLLTRKNPTKPSEDALKFKEEYEKLNGEENSKGVKYPIVNLNDNNPFSYITEEKAIEILENGTGLIYFGFSTCPWCRTLIPNLVTAADSNSLSEIYYLDIKDIRSTKSYENKKIVTAKEGTASYYNILSFLNDYLTEYMVSDDKGKTYPTNEKRLYAPTLVAVVDGKIVGFHEGTLDSHTDGYQELSSGQIEELNKILVELIMKVTDSICDNKC